MTHKLETLTAPIFMFFAVVILVLMTWATVRAQINPVDLAKPDIAVAVMSALVTAVTLLGVVVSVVGAFVADRASAQYENVSARIEGDLQRIKDGAEKHLTQIKEEAEVKVSTTQDNVNKITDKIDLVQRIVTEFEAKGLQKPEEIKKEIISDIEENLKERLAGLEKYVIEKVENDILEKLVEQYQMALGRARVRYDSGLMGGLQFPADQTPSG
jgi:hypothetical protein